MDIVRRLTKMDPNLIKMEKIDKILWGNISADLDRKLISMVKILWDRRLKFQMWTKYHGIMLTLYIKHSYVIQVYCSDIVAIYMEDSFQ